MKEEIDYEKINRSGLEKSEIREQEIKQHDEFIKKRIMKPNDWLNSQINKGDKNEFEE